MTDAIEMTQYPFIHNGIGTTKTVLDHGYVRLVDAMGNDNSIVRAARVSYDSAAKTGDDVVRDVKLINYLWKNKHTTPFEAATITFEVKLPIFVVRQWHRHRTQSYNEVSARYTELPEEFYIPEAMKIGTQSQSSKQARDITATETLETARRQDELSWYTVQCEHSFQVYRNLLKSGWPRELARMVLPLSTYTKMFTTMNLRNLFHFLELRLHSHAQYEIRVYAEAMLELITPLFPVATSAFKESINEHR